MISKYKNFNSFTRNNQLGIKLQIFYRQILGQDFITQLKYIHSK